MRHLIYVSDFNMGGANSADHAVPRSGYSNIGMELCRRLTDMDYDVKVLGLGYTGQEHNEKFSIIPCNTLQDAASYMNNLKFLWAGEGRDMQKGEGIDAVIVALDIHNYQEQLFPIVKKLGIKYICITPLESDPLCITWANLLREMDKVFFISQFGTDEAIKAGVDAEHIEIGIDTKAWRLRTEEEYQQIRKALGIDPDDFVVLTVADNQERKALGRGFQIVAALKLHRVKVKHILVTREHSMVGWKLYDLAWSVSIPATDLPNTYIDKSKHDMDEEQENFLVSLSSELRVFQSGMPFQDLYALYCAADAYLSCSKGEGLGLPVMEAMSVGVPVVANKTGALTELLANDRGLIVEPASWYYDPFGNQKRYDISIEDAKDCLMALVKLHDGKIWTQQTIKAREFMESKDWNKSAQQLANAVEKLMENGL